MTKKSDLDNAQEKAPAPSPEGTIPAEQPAYVLISRELDETRNLAVEQNRQLQDQLLRLRADFDNFRKRQEKDWEEKKKYANEALLEDLLPILDNFSLGMKAAENAKDAKSIQQGLSMVLGQIERFLTENGVTPVEALGKPFDPSLHDAVSRKETTEAPEGTVLEQHRRGYQLKGRLIRPATVVVAQAPGDKSAS